MARVLIIGYGNPLRGDDAFGWRAAERLRETITDSEVEVLTLHQLTPELMDSLSHVDLVIFIDAAEGPEPGVLSQREMKPAASAGASFTHHATPEALLAGAAALYGRAPKAHMITVTGADFSLSDELSPAVAERLEQAVSAALHKIAAKWQP
jgi:hydrogenase maturation protease